MKHLRLKHSDELSRVDKKRKLDDPSAGPSRPVKQQTLVQCLDKITLWDINNLKANEIHYKIGEMIAVDNQPFTIVENVGFINLVKSLEPRYQIPSRKYFSNNIIPTIYDKCCSKILDLIDIEKSQKNWISLTSDKWTCSETNESFLSLSGHWLTEEFKKMCVVLNARHFSGSHTGIAISDALSEMLQLWNLSTENNIHVLLRDNARNMISGANITGLRNESCFIHSLQLVLHDSIFSQKSISDLISKCRNIVTHFNHSQVACTRLKEIQTNFSLPHHKLVQDVATRWNSTYHMLKRIFEQKQAIALYSSEHNIPNLTAANFKLIENVIVLLEQFFTVTVEASSDEALISMVIPNLAALERFLSKKQNDEGSVTMKKGMLKSLQARFHNVELSKLYVIATVLDPRYKLTFLKPNIRAIAKNWIIEEMKSLSPIFENKEKYGNEQREPTTEEEKNEDDKIQDVWACLNEISFENESKQEEFRTEDNTSYSKEKQFENFLECPNIPHKENPLTWWAKNAAIYPELSKLARRYLSSPPSSIPSERMFSEAGIIYEERRNKLLPQNAEKLLFLHHNLPLLGFNY